MIYRDFLMAILLIVGETVHVDEDTLSIANLLQFMVAKTGSLDALAEPLSRRNDYPV